MSASVYPNRRPARGTARHLLSLLDLDAKEMEMILARASVLKAVRGSSEHPAPLAGKTVAVVLEKASTRTRVSFEVGIHELGGNPLTLTSDQAQLGRGEPIDDTARVLSRYVHAVAIRTFGQDRLEEFAAASDVPVINALTDLYHPCQILADLLTVKEALGDVAGRRVAWIGDGNNVAHSWINASALADFELVLACPEGFLPDDAVVSRARDEGAKISVVNRPADAVEGADVVTTDVWASMGQEAEQASRIRAFAGFQVDAALMRQASSEAVFLHCLPAHRGEEVSAEVIDGPWSRVWDEAENRLHTQKALLEFLMA